LLLVVDRQQAPNSDRLLLTNCMPSAPAVGPWSP